MGNYMTGAHPLQAPESDSSRVVTRYEAPNRNAALAQDTNIQLAIQSLDTLLARVMQEKAILKAQQRKSIDAGDLSEQESPFASLAAQILSNTPHLDDAALNRRNGSALSAPLYRCPMESTNRNQQQLQEANKVNYKNLFPRDSATMESLMGSMLSSYQVEDVTNADASNQRRQSELLAGLAGASTNESDAAGSALDTIRINLPEILDQQDEVTILRLLIKLLASKVTKLTDERQRLLQSVTVLSDINSEMASIIERGIQK